MAIQYTCSRGCCTVCYENVGTGRVAIITYNGDPYTTKELGEHIGGLTRRRILQRVYAEQCLTLRLSGGAKRGPRPSHTLIEKRVKNETAAAFCARRFVHHTKGGRHDV